MFGRSAKANATREILCPRCDTKLQVSTKTQSTMCGGCNKIIQVGDEKIKSYCARQELFTEGVVTVAKKGHVIAEVRVTGLVVQGAVKGPVRARESVSIEKNGKLYGDVRTPSLTVKDGGELIGHCVIGVPVEPPAAETPAKPKAKPKPTPKPRPRRVTPNKSSSPTPSGRPKKRRHVRA